MVEHRTYPGLVNFRTRICPFPVICISWLFVCAFEVVRSSCIQCRAGMVIQIQNKNAHTLRNEASSCTCFVIIFHFVLRASCARRCSLAHSFSACRARVWMLFLFIFTYLFLVFSLSRLLVAIIIHLAVGFRSHCTRCLCTLAHAYAHRRKCCWRCCGAHTAQWMLNKLRCRSLAQQKRKKKTKKFMPKWRGWRRRAQ